MPGCVRSAVEDDFHCMRVTLHHDKTTANSVKADLVRAPWSTCPGAVAKCETTFTGIALADFPAQKVKSTNCTHLYDLALLAAAHALDDTPLVYVVFVSDPIAGERSAQLCRNGKPVLAWSDENYRITGPAELAGMKLNAMRTWIESLDPVQQEAARILSWVSLIAHGRTIPMDKQSDASRMPPSCYTFQPEQASRAVRIGGTRDFSDGTVQPLDNYTEIQVA
ncbi:MAG TPA: hypothetical protein VIV27_02565 [Halioglobus sp.]